MTRNSVAIAVRTAAASTRAVNHLRGAVDFWQDLADAEYLIDSQSWRERLQAILAANAEVLDASGADLARFSEDAHKQRSVLLLLKAIRRAARHTDKERQAAQLP